ncbi:hypothetical protein Bbelb_290270 [Branchiostoma belcheri]|nr:hypothetical protein Bbelb_290270 [Branchiostoma belcheri]
MWTIGRRVLVDACGEVVRGWRCHEVETAAPGERTVCRAGDGARWGPGAARRVGGHRDEPTPKVSYAMPIPTPGLQKEFTGKLRQVHPEMQPTAGIHEAKSGKDRASVRNDGCQVGLKRLASTCFRLHFRQMTWFKAKEACKKEGARLTMHKTEELDIALRNLVRTEGQNGKYWIGLRDGIQENHLAVNRVFGNCACSTGQVPLVTPCGMIVAAVEAADEKIPHLLPIVSLGLRGSGLALEQRGLRCRLDLDWFSLRCSGLGLDCLTLSQSYSLLCRLRPEGLTRNRRGGGGCAPSCLLGLCAILTPVPPHRPDYLIKISPTVRRLQPYKSRSVSCPADMYCKEEGGASFSCWAN